MRLLAIADIHGATDVYEWLRDAVSDNGADALILAGDLLLGAWEEGQSKQAYRFVLPLLYTIPIPVFFIMGNDDHIELESQKEMIRSVHDRRLDMSLYNIAEYQYSPTFVGSCHEKPEDEIAADLKKMVRLIDKKIPCWLPTLTLMDMSIRLTLETMVDHILLKNGQRQAKSKKAASVTGG